MSVLKVISWPDKRLKEISKPVENIDSETQKFMDDMLETMYSYQGIGLAAVQVGILKRIIVIDVGHPSSRYAEGKNSKDSSNPIFIINPEISDSSETKSTYNEGCLSFPGQYAKVIRPEEITINYLDYHGKKQTLTANGLLATCIQHEIDHLNGTVFIDHISNLKRKMIAKRLEKRNKYN